MQAAMNHPRYFDGNGPRARNDERHDECEDDEDERGGEKADLVARERQRHGGGRYRCPTGADG